ncbi:hypothetical protein [Parabacteroides sp. FAFU027]|uniref:hypothetical protein n=1 Tax=Parabacteroides sp. FAFU027 TaxID=2922715 RepID=UPI001FAFFA09|nr:hypothetical protein [Parabacteroides sp. FAFU027]
MLLNINLNFLTIDGLKPFESILLYFGCFLFFIMIAGVLINIRGDIKKFVPFIAFSIIMIGYSGIKKISIDTKFGKIEVENRMLMNDPSNIQIKQDLENDISKINPSVVYSSKNLTQLAKAKTILGQYDEGTKYADKALQKEPGYVPAIEMKTLAQTSLAINFLMINPDNQQAISDVNKNLNNLKRISSRNNYTRLKVAEGNLLVGKTTEAKENAAVILSENPKEDKANEIIQLAKIKEDLQKAIESPADTFARSKAIKHIESIEKTASKSAIQSAVIAKAFQSLGNERKKNKYIDSTKIQLRRLK